MRSHKRKSRAIFQDFKYGLPIEIFLIENNLNFTLNVKKHKNILIKFGIYRF